MPTNTNLKDWGMVLHIADDNDESTMLHCPTWNNRLQEVHNSQLTAVSN